MIDRSRPLLKKKGFLFEPFQVRGEGLLAAQLSLPGDTELVIFSRAAQQRALLAREMAYHHVAQGELAGQPYLVSF